MGQCSVVSQAFLEAFWWKEDLPVHYIYVCGNNLGAEKHSVHAQILLYLIAVQCNS